MLSFYYMMSVSQGFWGTREHWQNIEGNKGTLGNFWEQGNKIRKITVRKHSDIRNRAHYLRSFYLWSFIHHCRSDVGLSLV